MLDGLEVRVAFSGVWKESLTELSGGQRYTQFHRITSSTSILENKLGLTL